jgi:putative oxidoreductase
MKIATIVIRTLIGLLLLFASISYFFKLMPQPVITGNLKTFQDGLEASVYLIPLSKTFELTCGLAFLLGRYVTLASILIFPIALNIICIHIFLAPEGLPVALFLFFGNVFLIYGNWNNYKSLFVAK